MTLPTEKSKRNIMFKDQKFAMLGASGTGKSSFWAQEPKAFFIETEAGLNAYEVFKMPARNWADLKNIYGLLAEAAEKGNFPYDLVVVDTIDRVISYADDEVIEQAKIFYKRIADKITTIGEIPEGGGWYRRTNMISNFLLALERLPCAVAFIGHLSLKTIKPDVGQDYTKSTISVGGQLGESLLAWTDHTLHLTATLRGDTLYRTVYTKPTQSREAKSRGGIVPNGWQWTENSAENYATFRALFT